MNFTRFQVSSCDFFDNWSAVEFLGSFGLKYLFAPKVLLKWSLELPWTTLLLKCSLYDV